MPAAAVSELGGAPPAEQISPLQARVDAAQPGDVIEVSAGVYAGDLVIDKPLRLSGPGRCPAGGVRARAVSCESAPAVW